MTTIKQFFRTHSEIVLISSAVFFLVVIVGFLYGTLNVVFSEINRAIGSVSAPSEASFDLQDAAKIDFRGLLNSSAAQAPMIVLPSPLPTFVPVSAVSVTTTVNTSTTIASSTKTTASGTAAQ